MKPWQIVSLVLLELEKAAVPGASALDLNNLAEQKIIELGGIPYNKGYQPKWAKTPFPYSICVNINSEIAHGLPTANKILKDGDVVSFDLGVKKDDLCGDAALTVIVGDQEKARGNAERLLRYTKRTLYRGIEMVKAGVTCREISHAMEYYASQMGYVTNLRMAGHGIGKEMHEYPRIPAAILEGMGDEVLVEGQMICLEPILTYRDRMGVYTADGWTLKTQDGRNSAIFEHQLLVTKDGCEILTDHIKL